MRIIHTVPSIAEQSSGPTYTVVRLALQLRQQGNDVTLACLDSAGHPPTPDWVLRFPRFRADRRLGFSQAMHRWLAGIARSGDPVVLHNHSLWMMPNVYPGWVARTYRLPYVVSPRGTLGAAAFKGGSAVKRLFWPLVQRPALARVSCFHATAESEAREIREHGFRQPIAVIPNGVDMPEGDFSAGARRKEVLFLGRIHPKKGLDVLLRAWGRVEASHPEWVLRIVGPDNGGYLGKMRELSSALGLRRAVFDGEIVGSARNEAYGRASLFVLPTRNENFAMTVAEALACGTPSIVSKGAPWSGLEDHRCGWWVDFGEEAMASALGSAMSCDASVLRGMGERGTAWMRADFSWEAVGAQMQDLYRWVLGGMPPSERPVTVNP